MSRSKSKSDEECLFEFYCDQIRDLPEHISFSMVKRHLFEYEQEGKQAMADRLRSRLRQFVQQRRKKK